MVSMTAAFAVAGVTQVYLERRVGMDFLAVQQELAVHFLGSFWPPACLRWAFWPLCTFVRSGWPVGEVDPQMTAEAA